MFQGVYIFEKKKHGCFILTYRTLEDLHSENLMELGVFLFLAWGEEKAATSKKPMAGWKKIHPGKLAWNPKMRFWKMKFSRKPVEVKKMIQVY